MGGLFIFRHLFTALRAVESDIYKTDNFKQITVHIAAAINFFSSASTSPSVSLRAL